MNFMVCNSPVSLDMRVITARCEKKSHLENCVYALTLPPGTVLWWVEVSHDMTEKDERVWKFLWVRS